MKKQRPYPKLIVTKKAAGSLKAGHPWIFAGEVIRLEPAHDGIQATNGCVVDVFEENGTWQGAALLSEASNIRARVVSRNANDLVNRAFWQRKLSWAWQYRKQVMEPRSLPSAVSDVTACRLIFSEADGIPGLVIDRYGDVLVSQIGTVGIELIRDELYGLLLEILQADSQEIRGIYERCDSTIRKKEGLELRQGWWRPSAQSQLRRAEQHEHAGILESSAPSTLKNSSESAEQTLSLDTSRVVYEGDIAYAIDLAHGQKTGFFLDQKYNRRAVRRLSEGRRMLDCFSHVGGFGLNAVAGGADFARCVDISESAIEAVRVNAKLNGFDERLSHACANVFDYLGKLKESKQYLRDEGGPFDLIVLDPPAFTKSRSAAQSAARGYRQINALAMKLLPRGSYLATCSCSHFMPTERFLSVVAQAAHDAGVQLRQVEARQQAPDHPIVVGIPETDYLKFFVFQIV
ncbi:MAG: class I SAM-dependent rRNA methyltransferase [Atopobiaceae bacterium]|nr:class I SAM-dependent rRNA methyltransferase [Atopobiaceae bacterium]